MAKHKLEPGQTELNCAIDQSHAIVVPAWELLELAHEGEDGPMPQPDTGAPVWAELPGFPPREEEPPDTDGTEEWWLDTLAYEGEDESGEGD
ncbi:hypothetical protein ENSA5_26220 [Enhygromyxa salina]|uniref:Uncharacterized protein n=1 Tax=Enhygromyxa salina TaxID=215803 RepID=A0A2S9YAN4_9BACT|nr:hypothetical protein [Enhygromyxa salina]PRQ02163.1 hypothetical protein ENSA5_26220 [Enhygromyxa salina]